MKKIAICGCSFMTSSRDNYFKLCGPDWPKKFPWAIDELPKWVRDELESFGYKHYPGFIDLLSDCMNVQLMYLSKGGASNFMIRQQIDQAIKLNPDLVIISATDPNRVDLPDNLMLHKQYYVYQNQKQDEQKSYYLLQGGLDKLTLANIPFIFLSGPMRKYDWSQYSTLWPTDQNQPWDTLPMQLDIPNHNTLEQHLIFFKTLLTILPKWN